MKILRNEERQVELKDNLFFAGTIYESFEALEEVLGKLKLEQPLFLVNLAKKSFADAVFNAAGENKPRAETMESVILPSSPITLNSDKYQHLQ